MSRLLLQNLVRTLCRVVDESPGQNSDAELLARFALHRDEQAFELLVWRHGAMVLNVCRRVLRHDQDAEDAFQAAFLALALEAGRIARRDQAAGWLYRVAFRIALKIRARRERDEQRARHAAIAESTLPAEDCRDVREVIDEEIARLPDRFRLPFLLCCLEGRSNSEAAAALGCPKGTIDSRLATAKQKLRDRLVRRGITLSAAAAAVDSLAAGEAAAALTNPIVRSTVAAAAALAAGSNIAGPLTSLARGVVQTMFAEKLRRLAVVVICGAFLLGGAGWAGFMAVADTPAKSNDKPQTPSSNKPEIAGKSEAPSESRIEQKRDTNKAAKPTNQELRRKLRENVTMEQGLDKTPLRDVLEYLSDRYAVQLRFDYAAFARLNFQQVPQLLDVPVSITKGRNLTLHQLLDEALAQVPLESSAIGLRLGILVKAGQIMIVPHYDVADQFPDTKGQAELPFPLGTSASAFGESITVNAEEQSLQEILRDLADMTGANIVIDVRAKDKTASKMSIQLQSCPLRTAVQLLADMADLKVAELDNVLYVTTAENATRIQKEHQEAEKRRKRIPKFSGDPPGA